MAWEPFQAPEWLTNKKLTQQINDLITNRPKYNIANEYGENQSLATDNAFGRDRAMQLQEGNIEQDAAGAITKAQDYSSSTSGILNTLSSINNGKNTALRGIATDEAAIKNQKLMQLFGTNKDMAEEKDKAWNYNTNMPYQNKMNELVQKRKNRQQNLWKVIDAVGSLGASALRGGGTGAAGAGKVGMQAGYGGDDSFPELGYV